MKLENIFVNACFAMLTFFPVCLYVIRLFGGA